MHRSVTIVRSTKSGFCTRLDSMTLQVLPKILLAWLDPDTTEASSNMTVASLGWGPQSGYPPVKQKRDERKYKFCFQLWDRWWKSATAVLRLCVCPSPLWGLGNTPFKPCVSHPSSVTVNCFVATKVVFTVTLMSNTYSVYTFNPPPECELKKVYKFRPKIFYVYFTWSRIFFSGDENGKK